MVHAQNVISIRLIVDWSRGDLVGLDSRASFLLDGQVFQPVEDGKESISNGFAVIHFVGDSQVVDTLAKHLAEPPCLELLCI